jgi:peptidoglycan/xylan/chitin deacetylase (PgdA/CDA1 family)
VSHWLEPVREALDAAPLPVEVFFRDDDAGWCDERLMALLDVFQAHRAPVDLAVIPAALEAPLARELAHRADRACGRLGLHQHGYAHRNHEPQGRKCEFGDARSPQDVKRDLAEGARMLAGLLGKRTDPIFTPPWNRCSAASAAALRELGVQVLSRDRTARPLALDGLEELPVALDWCKYTNGTQDASALGLEIASRFRSDATVGIMLHHAVMDAADLVRLHELLGLLSTHARSGWRSMRELIRPS